MSHTLAWTLIFGLMLLFILFLFPAQASAHITRAETGTNTVSREARTFAGIIASQCPGKWKSQTCMEKVSESALVLAANYAAALQKRGFENAVEKIKKNCAAATAASRIEVPAYAMESAYIECANMIYDISEETGLKPDQSHYQLLVSPILCMTEDKRCPGLESQMKDLLN